MNQNNYKRAFLLATVVCLVLGSALGYLAWSRYRPAPEDNTVVVAKGPDPGQAAPTAARTDASSPAAPPTTIQLSPERLQAIGVTTAIVGLQTVSNEIRVPGDVAVSDRQVAYVQTRFPGWIQRVFANASYQYVRKGQPLFTIYSPDLFSTEQEYLLAKQNQQAFDTDLHGTGARESGWLLQAATDRLRQFGIPASEIARLERTGVVQHEITIESPASGYVTDFNALPNQYAQTETKLYTIADLSRVWVYANVPQNDVAQLKPGTPAMVMVDAYPGRTFRGRIEQILPQVATATRTVRVRFVFSNPGVALMPGMYVNVSLSVPLGRQLLIPASGLLQAGTRQLAFLDHGGGRLEAREIEVGPRLDDHVIVLKGLKVGDCIVTSANFLVDSESQLKAAIDSFTPPPPGAGASAAMNAPTQQITVEFSTEPSPPRKGGNQLQVKLTGTDGKPVSGAQVTVTFYMPAMPAMGMAAIRRTAALSGKGNSSYEGPLQLDSGGTYQVTVTAARNGETIAAKQLTVNVTGGM